ncbi:MAG: 23S rRNA (pseudouridine(1915)-N(3))-methyltransferase RlmH [Clostridia bacterium]|nr:23S rRNA (pseudouridine(1915)-N(3))-methyltransferase RlmH [Clostridia bacterium]MBQ6721083.1 23S rRNA (pseudouridine(1915)-N(3))-methyltransferase RlmH [Clostridia bacterium]MBQ9401439.1 23S rRNA (pseudouridine(1915)-N(3))-methyltransferase RlmH [Clostridia bacterium]
MSTAVIAVGRMKEKPYRQMADEYIRRLSRFGKFEEIELNDLPEPAGSSPALEEQLRTREGEDVLQRLKQGDHVIALTIPGKRMSSEELAVHVAELRTRGAGRVVFLVGGSLGLGSNVLARADEELSMGPMTFPHQLARVMLLEQLYRAEKIIAGERYHK